MDELTLLRSARSDVAAPSQEAIERGRAALFERIAAETDPSGVVTAPIPPRRRRRWAGAITLSAGVAAVAIAATTVLGVGGWPGSAEAAAAAVLQEAAATTIETSDPVVGDGQYLLIATTAVYSWTDGRTAEPDVSFLLRSTDDLYVPADKSADWVRERSPSVPYQFFGEESKQIAQARYEAATAKPGGDGELLQAPGGGFYGVAPEKASDELAALPRDPQKLLDHIYRNTQDSGASQQSAALVFIADTLRTGVVPADLRAALYEAAALIPGIEVTEERATLDGQTGIAIGYVEAASNTRQDIIIDPATGFLIGERQVLLKAESGMPAGTAIAWTTVKTSVVDAAPTGGTPNGVFDEMGCVRNGPQDFQC